VLQDKEAPALPAPGRVSGVKRQDSLFPTVLALRAILNASSKAEQGLGIPVLDRVQSLSSELKRPARPSLSSELKRPAGRARARNTSPRQSTEP